MSLARKTINCIGQIYSGEIMEKNNKMDFDVKTKLIHLGQEFDPVTRAIIPPPYLTSTYVQESPGVSKYEYGRTDNPTFRNLEKAIASIEKNAVDCVVFSSGTAAINAIVNLLSSGDVILCDNNVYSGTRRLFVECFNKFGIKAVFTDSSDIENFKNFVNNQIKLVWIETPTNPMLKINDIEQIAKICKENKTIFCVDSTFATPLNQSPLTLGASIVIYSTTKYIAGHSDVIGGAITSNDINLINKLRWLRNALGLNPSPFDCWLIQRGLKTLDVRMQRHQENALKLAQWFEKQVFVEQVIYPGISSFYQYELAKKQMNGFSGIVSVVFKLTPKQIESILGRLQIWKVAESLGGVESLVDYPLLMTQSKLTIKERKDSGIPDTLVRFSVGIENVNDLINDIEDAIKINEINPRILLD